MPKKNYVNVFGKMFHITTAGKMLPGGPRQNKFTRCMKEKLAGKQATGKNLSKSQIQANRSNFGAAVKSCKGK